MTKPSVRRPMRLTTLTSIVTCAAAAIVAFGAFAGQAACTRPPGAPTDQVEDAGPPIDLEIMAFLSKARALHHEANVRESSDDLGGAISSLDRLVVGRSPHEGTRVPEVEEVLADTFARIAELRLRTQDLDGATKDIREGLAHAPEPSYFRGHLLEVEGIIEEARAAMLADGGKREDAQKAKARALELLREAVEIQEKVIQRSLDARDGGR